MRHLSVFLMLVGSVFVASADVPDRDRVGLYDPGTGTFFLENREGGFIEFKYQPPGWQPNWLPVSGDWNGDGEDTIGLYDPTNSRFHLENLDGPDFVFRFGPVNSGWLPLAGDWNGNGFDTVGFYDPTRGRFFLRNQLSGGVAEVSFSYGGANNGRVPIVGDWNGNGFDTIGVYDPAPGKSAFFLRNALAGGIADIRFDAGANGIPVFGDWNGDGRDTAGLYGGFLLQNWLDDMLADSEFRRGPVNTDWRPLAGNWDERDTDTGTDPAPNPNPQPVPGQCGPIANNVQIAPTSSALGALPGDASFDWNTNSKLMFNLGAGETHAHPFQTNASTTAFGQVGVARTSGPAGMKTLAISRCPDDFEVATVCKREVFEAGSINWKQGSAEPWQCRLEPNTSYYINVRDGSESNSGSGGCSSSSCNYFLQ